MVCGRCAVEDRGGDRRRAIGRLALGWATFHLPNRAKLSRTGDGFVALGVTCLAYGLTEIAHGYGFLAVFVAALGPALDRAGQQAITRSCTISPRSSSACS